MSGNQPFDAAKWIAQHTYDGVEISKEAKAIISSFALMWNLFEIALCDKFANVDKLVRLVERLEPATVDTDVQEAIRECVHYWRTRYFGGGQVGVSLDGLHFRDRDRRDVVETVLQQQESSLEQELLACLLIIHRLRNNLFHGLKEFSRLNLQVENLDYACRGLAAALMAIPSNDVLLRRE